ncbi:uncharacterized protein N7503_010308 [Penicillium pulvis]|uniref:uncharacterized protein n=1 Tax=Penicillium pulvis TaxID=1562058 RepID=UPI002547E604|nr:uncharacterized protein N7503_010308 [Penicillium pulvis]KAJ5785096.1 hypothetical protein N7503_010308 [Penicillium pulvis]
MHLQTSSLFDLFDQLLEILFKAITLFWDLQQKKDIGDMNWESADETLKTSVDIERDLLSWYHQLELENNLPLFMTQAGPASSMPIDAHDQMQTITFSNISSIHILLFYWLGLVVVYESMFEALETLAQSSRSQTPSDLYKKMGATDSLCRHFFTRISQCQADATTGKGLGTSIFAKATFLAAQKIRREWKRNDYTTIA